MFDFSNPLLIRPLLFLLMLGEAPLDGGVSVRGRMWVEHPHIQKGPLVSPSPETVCSNVQSGSVGGDGCSTRQIL